MNKEFKSIKQTADLCDLVSTMEVPLGEIRHLVCSQVLTEFAELE